jgi:hypothetical protein
MDEFLSAGFCRKLMAEFPPFEGQYALNERGEPGRKAVVTALAELGRPEHSPGLRVERSRRPGNRDPDVYQRELKFSRLIESLTGSPSFRIGRALTWPVRWVRSLLSAG